MILIAFFAAIRSFPYSKQKADKNCVLYCSTLQSRTLFCFVLFNCARGRTQSEGKGEEEAGRIVIGRVINAIRKTISKGKTAAGRQAAEETKRGEPKVIGQKVCCRTRRSYLKPFPPHFPPNPPLPHLSIVHQLQQRPRLWSRGARSSVECRLRRTPRRAQCTAPTAKEFTRTLCTICCSPTRSGAAQQPVLMAHLHRRPDRRKTVCTAVEALHLPCHCTWTRKPQSCYRKPRNECRSRISTWAAAYRPLPTSLANNRLPRFLTWELAPDCMLKSCIVVTQETWAFWKGGSLSFSLSFHDLVKVLRRFFLNQLTQISRHFTLDWPRIRIREPFASIHLSHFGISSAKSFSQVWFGFPPENQYFVVLLVNSFPRICFNSHLPIQISIELAIYFPSFYLTLFLFLSRRFFQALCQHISKYIGEYYQHSN